MFAGHLNSGRCLRAHHGAGRLLTWKCPSDPHTDWSCGGGSSDSRSSELEKGEVARPWVCKVPTGHAGCRQTHQVRPQEPGIRKSVCQLSQLCKWVTLRHLPEPRQPQRFSHRTHKPVRAGLAAAARHTLLVAGGQSWSHSRLTLPLTTFSKTLQVSTNLALPESHKTGSRA